MTTRTTFPPMRFRIQTGARTFETSFGGRLRWALEELIKAGPQGCTPIDTPGPRWSGYVCELRKSDVAIETVTEPHKGAFPGTHARYVLHSIVAPLASGDGK